MSDSCLRSFLSFLCFLLLLPWFCLDLTQYLGFYFVGHARHLIRRDMVDLGNCFFRKPFNDKKLKNDALSLLQAGEGLQDLQCFLLSLQFCQWIALVMRRWDKIALMVFDIIQIFHEYNFAFRIGRYGFFQAAEFGLCQSF